MNDGNTACIHDKPYRLSCSTEYRGTRYTMGVCDTHVKTENVRTTGIEMAGMNEKKKKK